MTRSIDMLAADVSDFLGCENDEGYGCSCCPGRMKAIRALDELVARAKQAEKERDEALHAEDVAESYRETAEARAKQAEEQAAQVQALLDDSNTAYLTLTGQHARACNQRDAAERANELLKSAYAHLEDGQKNKATRLRDAARAALEEART